MSAPFEVGRTHLLLADLAQQQHQAQEALQHVTIAHERFTALHVPRYVARTEQWTRTHGLRAVSGT
jgi:hypothetical protein